MCVRNRWTHQGMTKTMTGVEGDLKIQRVRFRKGAPSMSPQQEDTGPTPLPDPRGACCLSRQDSAGAGPAE